ncbi:MAG: hypothetical protein WDW36_004738 [Sanguina aurantia]
MSAAAEQLLTLTQPEAEAKLHAMKAAGTDSTAFELSMMLHRTAALFPQDATRWAWQKAQLVRYIFYCSSQVSQQKPVKGKKAAAEPPGTLSICGKDAGYYLALAWKAQAAHPLNNSRGSHVSTNLKQLLRDDPGLFAAFKMSSTKPKHVMAVTLNLGFFKALPLEPWIIIPNHPITSSHPSPLPSTHAWSATPLLPHGSHHASSVPAGAVGHGAVCAHMGVALCPAPSSWILEVNDSLQLEASEYPDLNPQHVAAPIPPPIVSSSPTIRAAGADSGLGSRSESVLSSLMNGGRSRPGSDLDHAVLSSSDLPSDSVYATSTVSSGSSDSADPLSSSSSSNGGDVNSSSSSSSSSSAGGEARPPLQPAPPINTIVLTTHTSLPFKAMIRHLAAVRHVAIDCETSGFTNTLVLVQICLPEVAGMFAKTVYILDLVQAGATSGKKMVAAIRPVLESPGVCKILHAPHLDFLVLAQQHQVKMVGMVDTQVLYGMVRAVEGSVGMMCPLYLTRGPKPWMNPIGLCNLLARFGIDHDLKDDFKAGYKSDPKFWSRRPLTREMIKYARMDVQFLLPMYHAMVRRILAAQPRFLTDPELYKTLPYLDRV